MRFSIRDMLIMTFVVALVVMAFLGRSKTNRLSLQVSDARENVKPLRRSISNIEYRLAESQPRMDYIDQVEAAAESAIAGFETVRERYGKAEPQPDKVVVRSVPAYHETLGTWTTHWRINVPSGKPVYLRTGVHTEANESNLDDVDWLSNTPFLDSNAYQIRLVPGINDLRILTTNLGSKLAIQLGDQQLLSTKFAGDHNGMGSSGPSGRDPLSYSLAKKTQDLRRIRFGNDSPEYMYWIWLSSNPNAEGFKPFPAVPITSIDQEQAASEATDE